MPSLTSLAEQIMAHAKVIDAALAEKGATEPSFEHDVMVELPVEMQPTREKLANAASEFQALVRGAAGITLDIATGWADLISLDVIYKFKIPEAVPLDGSASYAEIAATSGLNEELCRRYLRVAMSVHIFTQDAQDRVRHTAASRYLVTNADFRDAIGFEVAELAPAAPHVVDAWKKWGQDASEPNQTGWQLANNTELSLFDTFAQQPERGARLGATMRHFTADESWDLRHILRSFDWAALDVAGAHVVDVGGGTGAVSSFLAQNTHALKITVQDLAHVIEGRQAGLPAEYKDRIVYTAHNFLQPQSPDLKADVFFMRWVLHDWSDAYAVRILRGLIPALRPDTRVFIYEYILPEVPSTRPWERFGYQIDMMMAAAFNGRERTQAEFVKVLAQADERFVLHKIHRSEGAVMSLMEVTWKG